jgi:hypothetical protein
MDNGARKGLLFNCIAKIIGKKGRKKERGMPWKAYS